MTRWQLISNTADLLNVEAKRKDDSSKTKDYHGHEANPACIRDHISVPSTSDEQHHNREQQNACRNDENKCNEPFGGKIWRETDLFAIVDGEALPHQAESVAIRLHDPVG